MAEPIEIVVTIRINGAEVATTAVKEAAATQTGEAPATTKQLGYLRTLLREQGIPVEEQTQYVCDVVNRPLDSVSDLTITEAKVLIDTLKEGRRDHN